MIVLRPADANEVAEAWRVVAEPQRRAGLPVLSRQNLPTFDRTRYAAAAGLARGAYVLADTPKRQTRCDPDRHRQRSRVSASRSTRGLQAEGIAARVVSMPSLGVVRHGRTSLSRSVLPPDVTRRASRSSRPRPSAGSAMPGCAARSSACMTFGASAPIKELLVKFGFTGDNVVCGRQGSRSRNGIEACQPVEGACRIRPGRLARLSVSRELMQSGDLQQLIDEDGLRGVTSNPSIFEKAIGTRRRLRRGDRRRPRRSRRSSIGALFEHLAVARHRRTPPTCCGRVYEQTQRRDGFVSLEVSPYLAMDTQETIDEARRLWHEVKPPQSDGQGARHRSRASRRSAR